MKTTAFTLFCLLLLLGSSCKKNLPFDEDTPVDTLFPKAYYPIYPGSWWRYQRLSNATFYTETAGAYTEASISYNNYHSKPYIVPTMNGKPYFGYGVHRTFSSYHQPYIVFTHILSETQGELWDFQFDYIDPRVNGGTGIQRRTDSVGLTKNMDAGVFTDVIKILEFNGRPPYQRNYYYFAKDVGLIESGTYAPNSLQMIPQIRIDSFFINR